jgi:hypothetical protein
MLDNECHCSNLKAGNRGILRCSGTFKKIFVHAKFYPRASLTANVRFQPFSIHVILAVGMAKKAGCIWFGYGAKLMAPGLIDHRI